MLRRFLPISLLVILALLVPVPSLPAAASLPTAPSAEPQGRLVIHFLDIGQGDAELIKLPDGRTILIDSGDRGAPTVDLLQQLGVTQIDLAIASHPHTDHMAEMRDIMAAIPVKDFWDAGFNHPTTSYRRMLEEIDERNIGYYNPKRGGRRTFGDITLEVLNPSRSGFVNNNPNNASIVVRLTYGSKRFLFTGDTELEAWEQILETQRDKLDSDLLKAAHHGSHNGTTEALLDAVTPSLVTISCGMRNAHGHPHAPVMNLLRDRQNDIRLLRTDLHGTITVTSDGNSINVETEREADANRLYRTGRQLAPRRGR
jgi:competence protein ComEC